MYGYYILIKGLNKLSNLEKQTLNELLEGIMVKPKIESKEDILTAIDVVEAEMSWESFIIAVNGDFFANLKLYESVMFNSKAQLYESLRKNIKKEVFLETYNNDKTIFYYKSISQHVSESFKKEIFKTLYNDNEFLRSIKIYLENDKNTTKASVEANLHRNTLDNRLEKFMNVTGYDLRKFDDSVFIYLLLKDII